MTKDQSTRKNSVSRSNFNSPSLFPQPLLFVKYSNHRLILKGVCLFKFKSITLLLPQHSAAAASLIFSSVLAVSSCTQQRNLSLVAQKQTSKSSFQNHSTLQPGNFFIDPFEFDKTFPNFFCSTSAPSPAYAANWKLRQQQTRGPSVTNIALGWDKPFKEIEGIVLETAVSWELYQDGVRIKLGLLHAG